MLHVASDAGRGRWLGGPARSYTKCWEEESWPPRRPHSPSGSCAGSVHHGVVVRTNLPVPCLHFLARSSWQQSLESVAQRRSLRALPLTRLPHRGRHDRGTEGGGSRAQGPVPPQCPRVRTPAAPQGQRKVFPAPKPNDVRLMPQHPPQADSDRLRVRIPFVTRHSNESSVSHTERAS